MCVAEKNGFSSKYLSWPVVVVCITIILETSLISLHTYSYQHTLVEDSVDEIFFVITAIFLVLSICWLFTSSSWDFLYSHFRVIRGIQSVVMITNGSMLILSAVRTKNSENCQIIEALHEGLHQCQQFEIRLVIGSLAIMDGIVYFFRRPILLTKVERFCPRSSMTPHLRSQEGKFRRKSSKGGRKGMEDDEERLNETQTKTGMPSSHMLMRVDSDFDCILKVDVSDRQRRSSQQSQQGGGGYLSDNCDGGGVGGGKVNEGNLTQAVESLSDVLNMNVSKSPNSFYTFNNQEYFLPTVDVLSPKTCRYNNDPDRCSTLTRQVETLNGFA